MTLVDAETGEIVRTLEECEAVIERGLATFIDVGDALVTIRDARLYRQTHDTFEDYCRERWGFSSRRANQLMDAANVVGAIGTTVPIRPTNEAQARALTPLKDEPEAMAEVMVKVTEATNGKPTAKAIADAVEVELEKRRRQVEQREQDRAEIKAIADEFNPPNFDPAENEDAVRQRGEFARLCRDLSKLPPAAEFIARHGTGLRDRHYELAERAYAWLDEFLLEARGDK